ncbi:mucin-2 [Streptomyces noursei]|uniref:mucin-2 n=1 Tax=Streptomyces noursei TaxID=1971 RepID=UPI0023B84AA9|nr:mucin-2 [Streptomyces noursei]
MPWFKIDDASHSHPKFMRAGNAALGLWLRGGAYAAQHLTEGTVPGVVAQLYGTAPQARKLVAVGLWHEHGHTCPRCPQPGPGDYVMHDFFEGGRNVTRAQHEANKKSAAERAAKSRATRKRSENTDDSSSNRDSNDDEKPENEPRKAPPFEGSAAGQEGVSRRTPADGVTPTQAKPSPPSPPKEETEERQPARRAGARDIPQIGNRPRIPNDCQPLVEAAQAAALHVGWDLRPEEWFLVEALIRRCGIPALVASATASWQGARTQPRSASYFIPAWRALPDALPASDTTALPAAVGATVIPLGPTPRHAGPRTSTTDARVQQALDVGTRLQALADAQNAQESQ